MRYCLESSFGDRAGAASATAGSTKRANSDWSKPPLAAGCEHNGCRERTGKDGKGREGRGERQSQQDTRRTGQGCEEDRRSYEIGQRVRRGCMVGSGEVGFDLAVLLRGKDACGARMRVLKYRHERRWCAYLRSDCRWQLVLITH